MKTISIANLKGGVHTTTTAVSMAELIADRYQKKVLLLDNDKQGNASRLFRLYNPESLRGAPDMIKTREARKNMVQTENQNLSIIPCNYYMEQAVLDLQNDRASKQHNRYKEALDSVGDIFDYCIIDNPPDLGLNVVNALVASQEIIIPLHLDDYSMDGLDMLVEQIMSMRIFNPDIKLAGCLITGFEKTETSVAAEEWLREKSGQPVFERHIRHFKRAKDATFMHQSLITYCIRSGAAQDYKKFVEEYMGRERK